MNAWLLVLTALLMGCVSSEPYDQDVMQNITHGLMYRRGDGLEAIQCQGGLVPKMCGSVEIVGEQIFSDCSDQVYNCLFNAVDVFAVPRTGLSLGQEYRAFGAKFAVERCFGHRGECDVAMIKSECADASACKCRSVMRRRITTFYFSEDLGITTFYSIDETESLSVDSKEVVDIIPLATFVLTSDQGFLRMPLALPKATLSAECRK